MDLSNYIGETSSYDKKVMLEVKRPKSWLKSVVAFANTNGGKIFFGIDDNDKLLGLENAKQDSEIISEIIKTKLDPIPQITLNIERIDNKDFIILSIFSGNETPYYLIDGASRIAFIRIGNESVVANSNQLKNLVLRGINKTFDSISSDIKIDRASFSKLKAVYYQKTKKDLVDSDLISFSLVDDKGYLTYAGALLADERLVYQSRIFATRWNGLDKANSRLEALDDKEYEGGLLYLLQSGEDFIKSNSKKMWKKGNEARIEYPDYPEIAIREALVNALIHRDYSEIGSEVHIDIYDDRLEIYSPGGMFDGTLIQEQNPYQISSKRRNPIIADLFSRMNLMERRGSGLKKILDNYEIQENYNETLKAEFRSTQSSFYIILKNLNYKVAIKNGDKVAISIDKVAINIDKNQEEIILEFAKANKLFKTKDIENLLNVKSARARRILSKMVDNNLLVPIGENKNRKYTLKDTN
ncbi:putative DNA binding domain-containing protein [Carnobacteriaceae bacterium zg-ZUI78]|nr:putative DNA binding domain-containing protein [Carnobacteriaceae bacterium zg-ZUI78]